MSWFKRSPTHVHDWRETGRVKVPAIPHPGRVEGYETVMKVIEAMQDRTSIHLRCSTCGDVKCETLLGWMPTHTVMRWEAGPHLSTIHPPHPICGTAFDVPNGTDVMTAICTDLLGHAGPHSYHP